MGTNKPTTRPITMDKMTKRLKVGRGALHMLLSRGLLPGRKVGETWVWHPHDATLLAARHTAFGKLIKAYVPKIRRRGENGRTCPGCGRVYTGTSYLPLLSHMRGCPEMWKLLGPPPEVPIRYVSCAAFAKQLGMSASTVVNYIAEGRILGHDVGNGKYYIDADVAQGLTRDTLRTLPAPNEPSTREAKRGELRLDGMAKLFKVYPTTVWKYVKAGRIPKGKLVIRDGHRVYAWGRDEMTALAKNFTIMRATAAHETRAGSGPERKASGNGGKVRENGKPVVPTNGDGALYRESLINLATEVIDGKRPVDDLVWALQKRNQRIQEITSELAELGVPVQA